MFTTSKFKWIGSIILAGTLLVLAIFGGTWGTSYAADASVNVAPVISYIDPFAVPVGSPDTIIEIWGSNFGTTTDTRVRLTGGGFDELYPPDEISTGRIVVTIPALLLDQPTLYILTVIKSKSGTIPTIPTIPNPPDDEISNPVPFTVYGPDTYLPIIQKNALR